MRAFKDRADAGEQLAERLKAIRAKRPLVLALPRGGVPIGAKVAEALSCPLDTIVARKIGAPFNPEFAVGAIAPQGIVLLDDDAIAQSGSSRAAVEGTIARERRELERRVGAYKSGSYSIGYVPDVIFIVDDGIATGFTARAACLAARAKYKKAKIIVATPVCLADTAELGACADEVICLERPALFAVGAAYSRFPQVSDDEVEQFLHRIR